MDLTGVHSAAAEPAALDSAVVACAQSQRPALGSEPGASGTIGRRLQAFDASGDAAPLLKGSLSKGFGFWTLATLSVLQLCAVIGAWLYLQHRPRGQSTSTFDVGSFPISVAPALPCHWTAIGNNLAAGICCMGVIIALIMRKLVPDPFRRALSMCAAAVFALLGATYLLPGLGIDVEIWGARPFMRMGAGTWTRWYMCTTFIDCSLVAVCERGGPASTPPSPCERPGSASATGRPSAGGISWPVIAPLDYALGALIATPTAVATMLPARYAVLLETLTSPAVLSCMLWTRSRYSREHDGSCASSLCPAELLQVEAAYCFVRTLSKRLIWAAGAWWSLYVMMPSNADYMPVMLATAILLECMIQSVNYYGVLLYKMMAYEERVALQQRADSEHQSSEAKSLFLRFVFHEVRVPMNAVKLALDSVAEEEGLSHDGRETVHMAQLSATTMTTIINNVLQLSAIEQGAFKIARGPSSISDLLRTVAHQMQPWASASKVQLQLAIDPAIPSCLMLDGPRISQVVSNFVSNALKFVPQDGSGRVTVTARLIGRQAPAQACCGSGLASPLSSQLVPAATVLHAASAPAGPDHLCIEVTDNGVGISPEEQAKLFVPFHQINSGDNVKKVVGTGLGLAITKEIATRHGGEVGVRSEVGKGSTFWMQLPAQACATAAAESAAAAGSSPIAGQYAVPRPATGQATSERAAARSQVPATAMPPADGAPARPQRPYSGDTASETQSPSATISAGTSGGARGRSQGRPMGSGSPARGPGLRPRLCALVVDDDKPTLRLMQRVVQKCSAALDGAGAGAEPAHAAAGAACNVAEVSRGAQAHEAVATTHTPIQSSLISPSGPPAAFKRVAFTACANGKEAVDVLAACTREDELPDVILLDGMMPVMDGYECARALRSLQAERRWPHLVIIGVTGNALEEDQRAFITAGADAVVTKPVSVDLLVAAISQARHVQR